MHEKQLRSWLLLLHVTAHGQSTNAEISIPTTINSKSGWVSVVPAIPLRADMADSVNPWPCESYSQFRTHRRPTRSRNSDCLWHFFLLSPTKAYLLGIIRFFGWVFSLGAWKVGWPFLRNRLPFGHEWIRMRTAGRALARWLIGACDRVTGGWRPHSEAHRLLPSSVFLLIPPVSLLRLRMASVNCWCCHGKPHRDQPALPTQRYTATPITAHFLWTCPSPSVRTLVPLPCLHIEAPVSSRHPLPFLS